MFDIGFAELIVIAIIGLLVLGPERLPHAIKKLMLWTGRLKRGFAAMKSEIEREIGADDIRRQLHNESIMQDLKQAQADVNRQINEFKQSVDSSVEKLENSVDVNQATSFAQSEASHNTEPGHTIAPDQQPKAKPTSATSSLND
ncbi:Sec-independent protein translocase protein TatB [Spartinivicinus poritis]|uniref:Sec-independent protein translocase protein TatB n=1 Tax=Spartinivicinus poritis TaxID=2994640 RepID=A0ABT5U5T9_9GAMM|nr:Sec-independent protein translocase protein TatB [Spartinivicinus sp. A2-2]MDE1461724.1 Sec-independent protein translocase protein TatB [Spartinivicinus sp. A2-2]